MAHFSVTSRLSQAQTKAMAIIFTQPKIHSALLLWPWGDKEWWRMLYCLIWVLWSFLFWYYFNISILKSRRLHCCADLPFLGLLVFLFVTHNIWSVHRRSQKVNARSRIVQKKSLPCKKSGGFGLVFIFFLGWCFFRMKIHLITGCHHQDSHYLVFCVVVSSVLGGLGLFVLSLFFLFYIFSVFFFFILMQLICPCKIWFVVLKLCRVLECTHFSLLLKSVLYPL